MKKSLNTWIREHRTDIDEHIKHVCGNSVRINDDERRSWVLNDGGLYWWAKREGVDV